MGFGSDRSSHVSKPASLHRRDWLRQQGWAFSLLGPLGAVTATLTGCGGGGNSPVQPENATPNAAGLVEVSLLLNWYPEPEHGGYYAARELGFYREVGLNVTIVHGGPGKPVSPQLDQKRFTFGIENADDLIISRSRGADVVGVMAPIQKSPRCIMVHESSGITDLADLKGVTLAIASEDPFARFLKTKVSLDQVELVPYAGGIKGFLANPKFAQQGYAFSEPILAQLQGAKPRTLLLADLGFNPYTSMLLTHSDWVKRDPQMVRNMALASIRGWKAYLEGPAPINQLLKRDNPEMTDQLLASGALSLLDYCQSPQSPDPEFGGMTPDRMRTLKSQLESTDLLKDADFDPVSLIQDQVWKS